MLLWKTWKKGHVVVPLFIDYGQRAAAQEHRAASRICGKIGINLERIDIPGLSDIDNGLSDPVHWAAHVFHARNMILLSVAASLAASRSIRVIGIGVHGTADFPDQTGAFVRSAERTLSKATGAKMVLFAPFIKFNKADIAKLGMDAGTPIGMTYSCYMGRRAPCGRCPSCTDRQRALDWMVQNA
ncbi:MAG: 7-cyano-7-deazaguanine synthase [Alphaproteobacteria bacterium]|nr:7-cyano-7-deazaguanine synthase [Alphaproteobacteria bacterium]